MSYCSKKAIRVLLNNTSYTKSRGCRVPESETYRRGLTKPAVRAKKGRELLVQSDGITNLFVPEQ
jgi:hypothetical protein